MNFQDRFNEWTDLDIAMHELAIQIGIIDEKESFAEFKWIYWTDNAYGKLLNELLRNLIQLEILEIDIDEEKVRKNNSFKIKVKSNE